MADSIPRSVAGLADAIDAFVDALGTAERADASRLMPETFADLTDCAAAIRAGITARDDAWRAYRAAVTALEASRKRAEGTFRPARREANNSRAMTPELRALAGLGNPVGRGRTGALPVVADLTAIVRPSGAVFLDWTGPTGGALRYEVFALGLGGGEGEWDLIGTASATDFVDRAARPGVRTAYRVQAVRGERRGAVSNETMIYA